MLKEILREQSWFRPVRLANLKRRAVQNRPDWARLLSDADRAALGPEPGAPRILFATSVGLHLVANAADSLFAAALMARGAEVEVLLCDAALPACMACESNWYPRVERFVAQGPAELCGACIGPAERMFADLPIRLRRYSEFITEEDRERARALAASTPLSEVEGLVVDSVPVGEHAVAGALRFFARGDLSGEPMAEPVLQRYLEASLLIARAGARLFKEGGYDAAVLHHGIYVPQGILSAAAREAQTRVVTWNLAYRERCFIFSADDTYHHTLMDEPVEDWQDIDWSPDHDERISSYIQSRASGRQDWISFYDRSEEDFGLIAEDLGIDPGKPIALLLTNVVWDAQLHYPGRAFDTMLDWIMASIEAVLPREDLQLVIRVHPAEVSGALPSRQRVEDEIRRRYPALPPHIIVVPAEHPASSYVIAKHSNAALIYASRMGVELAALGLPVITAGEAWIRNKGLTQDARDREHYETLLAALPLAAPPSEAQVARARKYAFHFFFRRMIPVDFLQPQPGWPPFAMPQLSLEDLRAGGSPGLDIICDGIVTGSPFVYPAERRMAAATPVRPQAGALQAAKKAS